MSFFEHKDCKYYPCHDIGEINCIFCYCPLYGTECGGNYEVLKNGKRDCSKCVVPHVKENFDIVIDKIRELK
jgi:Zn-finger protein